MSENNQNKGIINRSRESRSREEHAMYEELMTRERELSDYRAMLRDRERELEELQTRLKNDQSERERAFHNQLKEREDFFDRREKDLFNRQKVMEEKLANRLKEVDQLRESLQNEILYKEKELNQLIVEAEKEKERYREESRQEIESKSQKFVDSALQLLKKKEEKFYNISTAWSVVGAMSIAAGIGFAIYTTISGADVYHQGSSHNLSYYIYTLFRGLIVVGLFGLLSRYAFIYSSSFMHESLKSGERLHAIKFGEFYLDAYGADANWDQLREAFENWNISGRSAFSQGSGDTQASVSTNQIYTIVNKALARKLKNLDAEKSVV